MKLTLIRLLLIVVFYLLAQYVLHAPEALLLAFVTAYIVEPWVATKI